MNPVILIAGIIGAIASGNALGAAIGHICNKRFKKNLPADREATEFHIKAILTQPEAGCSVDEVVGYIQVCGISKAENS